MTDITVVDDPDRGAYVATLDGTEAGVIVYQRPRPGVIDLQHTIVEPAAEGHGVGSTMIKFALDAARAAGDQVIPTCPFVKKYLARHPDERDVVA